MEPQQPASSRSSFSDYPSAVSGPIPIFDHHLRYISDSYLAFFQERKRIEETYVESLKRLHRKIKYVDSQLDDRSDMATARRVWGEVVDGVEREAHAREAFVATLTVDAINPLTSLKDTQERTRKRIKEDLKDSSAAYNEYAETVLPKLKSRYTKRFFEVEEQKRANAPPGPTSPPPVAENTTSYLNHKGGINPGGPSRPTNPQPLRALDRKPSGSGPRNRSPSAGTGLSDLAHQGKKQLNQIIGGFLDKRGAPDGFGSRENQALRNVRAKREADEADKDYRKGVHWLETLRLRRTKILEGGYKSLEMFVEESGTVLKRILQRYSDNLQATCKTEASLAEGLLPQIQKISPEKDVLKVTANIPRSLALAVPDPILYEHGQVGSCNDLLFGFSLVDYATSKGLHDGQIPKIVRICIDAIDKRGLNSEGIYRVSGRHAVVQAFQHDLEKDEEEFEFTDKDDVYAIASLLKLYLRELPEPLFRFPLQDRMQHTEGRAEHESNNFVLLRSKIRRLPPVHQATLKALIEHLNRVAAHSDRNKMDPKNLAIVFGSVIFGEDDMPKGGDLLSVHTTKDTLMEDLIVNARKIFDDPTVAPSSPPLPPTPATEPVPVYYGSKSTKVVSVPPALPPQEVTSPTSPQDFTPRLPPRPAGSIHPSSRTYSNGSPHKQQRPDNAHPASSASDGTDVDSDAISLPPSPSAIDSNLSLSSLAGGHSQAASEDTQHTQDTRPRTPPPLPPRVGIPSQQQNIYPFPHTATPEASKAGNPPAKGEDYFYV